MTEERFDAIEDFIRLGDIGIQHTVGLVVHGLGSLPVFQALGVDEHIQRRSLQRCLAAHGGAAGIGHSQTAALGGKNGNAIQGLAAQLHDVHGHRAGGDGGLLQDGVPVGVVLGNAVGLGQGHEALVVGLHLVQKLLLQFVTALFQGDDLLLHIGILLLAQGEGAETMVDLEDRFIELAFGVSDMKRLTKQEVKDYIRYIADRRLMGLGLKPIFKSEKNPLNWVDAMLGVTHTNFFENRVVDYAKGALTGSWGDVWGAAGSKE